MLSVSPKRPQRRDRAEHRQRNGGGDDQRRAETAEEQQNHQAGERGGNDALADDAADRGIDEYRLIADRREQEIAGQGFFHLQHFFLDALDDRERRDRAVLQDDHQHGTVAVDVNDIGLRRAAVADMGDVMNVDHRAIDGFDRQVAERVDHGRRVVELNRVFKGTDFLRADRGNQVLRGERVGDVLAGEAARPHRLRIDIDLHLAKLAAERPGHRRAGHGDDGNADEVEAEVEQRLLGQAFARQRELDDRDGRGVVVQDQRRHGAGRHVPEQGLRDGGDLGVGGANVGTLLEEHLDDADAGVRVRLDVLDVVDRRGQRPLELGDHAAGHLLRRQSGIAPDHRDHRDSDFREYVDGRAPGRERPDDEEKESEDDEGVGAPQCDADKGSHSVPAPQLVNTAARHGLHRDRPAAANFLLRGAT